MKTSLRTLSGAALLAMAFGLGACSNMSHQDKTTPAGAAIGGVAGSVLTDGSAAGTLGGAALGGYAGREYGKRK